MRTRSIPAAARAAPPTEIQADAIADVARVDAGDVMVRSDPSTLVYASAPRASVTDSQAQRDADLATEFPQLAPMLRNPSAFVETMKARFTAQQTLTPDDPYRFDYKEIGLPVLAELRQRLENAMAEISARPSLTDDEDLARRYYGDMANEMAQHLANGAVPYRRVLTLSHFATRAMSAFSHKKLSAYDRVWLKVDLYSQRYHQRPIAEEYADFKNDRIAVFQAVRKRREGLADVLFDKTQLQTLFIPTTGALSEHLLLRLMAHPEMHLEGHADDIMLADGFRRSPGLFLMHDDRHEETKHWRYVQYRTKHALTAKQEKALVGLQERWYAELKSATDAEPDPELRETLRYYEFNFHHDNGYPMTPSSYLEAKNAKTIAVGLYDFMKIGGQPTTFDKPIRRIRAADVWLREFWSARVAEEQAFFDAR